MIKQTVLITIALAGIFFGTIVSPSANPIDPPKSIHVFVALCDNKNQGIVPVPSKLGNGKDSDNNLYWGALYGIKTYFRKSDRWQLLVKIKKPGPGILERCLFIHKNEKIYLLADAYEGNFIKQAITDFLNAAAGYDGNTLTFKLNQKKIQVGVRGWANLVSYIGHNGLMEFEVKTPKKGKNQNSPQAIVLACISRNYFYEILKESGGTPLLLTTGFMAPEAYTLENALEGWILNEDRKSIHLRAAKAYSQYQKCSLNSAKRLFSVAR